jgi:type IV pilus assembly protein PilA
VARSRPLSDAGGFTLVELLIVVLLVGILAAIAIPQFVGQSAKAQDASAKSDVKRISQMIEECKLEHASYTSCNSDAELDGTPGLDWGTGAGQSTVWLANSNSYTVYSTSRAATSGSNHVFLISKLAGGSSVRWCLVDGGNAGGCQDWAW